ncbi:MAG: NAD(P)H-hydrate epimerase [Pseudomonadota bacterium]
MAEPIKAAQMRAIEEAAIASGSVTGEELMERAGEGVVAAIFHEWPDLAEGPHNAVVLAGPGNNGGDGSVVARRLQEAGWTAHIALTTDPRRLKGDAATAFAKLGLSAEELLPYRGEAIFHRLASGGTVLLIDALLGIGQNRAADAILAPYHEAWDLWASGKRDGEVRTLSIDVPTGYDSETGALTARNPFEPDLTVTFHREKPVHPIIRSHGYKVALADIGLSPWDDPAAGA